MRMTNEQIIKELKDEFILARFGLGEANEKRIINLFLQKLQEAEERGYENGYGERVKTLLNDNEAVAKLIIEAKQEERERIIKFVKNIEDRIYPKDVFIEPPLKVFTEIHEFLQKKGRTLDAISADYARRNIRLVAKEIEENYPLQNTDKEL